LLLALTTALCFQVALADTEETIYACTDEGCTIAGDNYPSFDAAEANDISRNVGGGFIDVVSTPVIQWTIIYYDCLNATTIGFDDSVVGPQAQAVVAAVLSYIGNALEFPSGSTQRQFEVIFRDSQNIMGGQTLATAGTFFSNLANSFNDPFSLRHYVLGTDPLPTNPDIFATVNFGQNYFFDPTLTGTPAGNQFDFYSLMLHEFTHSLGFISLTREDGTSQFNVVNARSTFDRLFFATTPMMDVYAANGGLNLPASFTTGAQGQIVATNTELAMCTDTAVIFTPGTFQDGASLSHLDPTGLAGVVMNPTLAGGSTRREYLAVEGSILQSLGWIFNSNIQTCVSATPPPTTLTPTTPTPTPPPTTLTPTTPTPTPPPTTLTPTTPTPTPPPTTLTPTTATPTPPPTTLAPTESFFTVTVWLTDALTGTPITGLNDGDIIDLSTLVTNSVRIRVTSLGADFVIFNVNGDTNNAIFTPFESNAFVPVSGPVNLVIDVDFGRSAPPQRVALVFSFQQAQISGDPHFVGFRNQRYDFHGFAGDIYNIVTDTGLHMNSHFVDADLRVQKTKTYMGAIAIKVCHHLYGPIKFLFSCERGSLNQQKIEVSFKNGTTVDIEKNSKYDFGKPLMVKRSRLANKKTVLTTAYGYQFQFRFSSSQHSSCHVNLRSKYTKQGGPYPHGVLGQTTYGVPNAKGEGRNSLNIVEGKVSDYVEPELFSHSSKYSKFKRACGPILDVMDSEGMTAWAA